jgi:hypothetical protein
MKREKLKYGKLKVGSNIKMLSVPITFTNTNKLRNT